MRSRLTFAHPLFTGASAIIGIIILAILCFFEPAHSGRGEVVTNGGFERLDKNGFPVDWEPVGRPPVSIIGVVRDAHSGRYALRLKRVKDERGIETGLNRRWRPYSGERGAMLNQLKGAVRFWYKAISASGGAKLCIYIIPMSAKPFEDTGMPRAVFEIPVQHIGDGKWHLGAVVYDFTKSPKVKWVHISPRIVGGTGELLLDDFEWVERVGALPRVWKVTLQEDATAPGKVCTIEAEVGNAGDSPDDLRVSIQLPKGLNTSDVRTLTLQNVPPKQTRYVSWRVRGERRRRSIVTVQCVAGEFTCDYPLTLKPSLKVFTPMPERFLLDVGERTAIRVQVRNIGTAYSHGISGKLTVESGLRLQSNAIQHSQVIPPDGTATLVWQVQLDQQSGASKQEYKATVDVRGDGLEEPYRFTVTLLHAKVAPEKVRTTATRALDASKEDWGAFLQNDCLRLLLPYQGEGIGAIELQVMRGGRWVTVGRMPGLGECKWQLPNGRVEGVYWLGRGPVNIETRVTQGTAQLICTATHVDNGGAQWHFRWVFQVHPASRTVDVSYSCSSNRVRKLLCFEGPMLYAGEGAWGSAKDEAIFPGLEWLVDDEISSSDLDIEATHPHRIRYVPHPNKITIPCMGVYRDGILVGLLWDALQRWDGEHTRPAATFASPDWFNGRNAHLMGLFLPSVPDWVEENERQAKVSYEMPPNRPIRINCAIVLDGNARDALTVVDHWFSRYGVPAPLPLPRGDWMREIAFSMRAYLESLWDDEQKGWWTSKHGHPLMSRVARPRHYIYDIFMALHLLKDEALKDKLRARLREVGVTDRAIASADDLGITWDDPLMQIARWQGRAVSHLSGRGDEGGWAYNAKRRGTGVFEGADYALLGKHGTHAIGLCARRTYEILRYALLTGDRAIFEAAKKSLKFMEQFRVPRAAQVWEVPVHTPDILAAADAVDAYIEAYRFSGDEHYLEQARRWARAGLPFVYVWHVPEFPFMHYASIPVFGATWFRGSWFGRAVQWNGLRYAYALFKLSQYDRSFPWRKVSEGITISAMYQQAGEGEDVALWPDSISCMDARKSRWVFSPAQILKNVYAYIGYDTEPQTVVMRCNGSQIHISLRGRLDGLMCSDDALQFDAVPHAGLPTYVLIAPVARPTEVRINGNVVKFQLRSTGGNQPHWVYNPVCNAVAVRIPTGKRMRVEITGMRVVDRTALPIAKGEFRFEFERGFDGWLPMHDVADMDIRDGKLFGRITGPDPYLVRPGVDWDGDRYKLVRIRMRVTGGAGAQFYWVTATSPVFAEDKVVRFEIIPDGKFHEYVVRIGEHPQWAGQRIRAIRLDPTSGVTDAVFEVDWIRGE